MKQDIFTQAKPTKKAETTMFEVSDSGREYKYKGNDRYVKPFISFIESLGFTVVHKYEHSSNIVINGEEFSVNDHNAAYMSKNPYGNKTSIRKASNRFVILEKGVDGYWLKVFVNKEMDADKLRKQIDRAIQAKIANRKEAEDRKNMDNNNIFLIATHFLANTKIKSQCRDIYIEKGEIIFYLPAYGSVRIKANSGALVSASFHVQELRSIDAIREFEILAATSAQQLTSLSNEIEHADKLPEGLARWSENAYYRRFNVATMEVEK